MALAHRLNELALANEQGLLNDDEYRLLRQNVFEQYSSNAYVPVEPSLVPVILSRTPAATSPQKPNHDPPRNSAVIASKMKTPLSHGVANLIRRATGRKAIVHDNPMTKDSRKPAINLPSNDSVKRSLIPRLLHQKPTELSLRTTASTSTLERNSPSRSSKRREDSRRDSLAVPLSPIKSARRIVPTSSVSFPSVPDVFDETNLSTASDIRNAIRRTEDEARRLVDAFFNLETTTLRRVQKQNAHRNPVNTPTSVNILLEGKEWREHRIVPSPSSPLLDGKQRLGQTSGESNSDGLSIRSGSSYTTSLSMSKSISSLPKLTPSSPLSPHFRTTSITLLRKNSISSVSSQATSMASTGMLAANSSTSLSRSSSHLPLRKTLRNSERPSADNPPNNELHDDPEISDIRRRKEELVARYTARLEFLRAKLKGAELHEKLLRK